MRILALACLGVSSCFAVDVMPSVWGGYGYPIDAFGAVECVIGPTSYGHESMYVSGLWSAATVGQSGLKLDCGYGMKGGIFIPAMSAAGGLSFYRQWRDAHGIDSGGNYFGIAASGELFFFHAQVGAYLPGNNEAESVLGMASFGFGF